MAAQRYITRPRTSERIPQEYKNSQDIGRRRYVINTIPLSGYTKRVAAFRDDRCGENEYILLSNSDLLECLESGIVYVETDGNYCPAITYYVENGMVIAGYYLTMSITPASGDAVLVATVVDFVGHDYSESGE